MSQTTTVTLYTKSGCHLCEAVEQVIVEVRKTRDFHFRKCNILEDPISEARYRNDIPVIFVNDVEIARHRLSREELCRGLDRVAGRN